MKKLTLGLGIFILLSGLSNKAAAQYYFYDNDHYDNPLLIEFGASVNMMNCLTDVGGRKGTGKKFIKDVNWGKAQLGGSFYISANYKYALSLRAEVNIGKLKAEDKVLESVKTTTFGRYERNLSFRTKISEFMLAAEWHPLFTFIPKDNDDWTPPMFSPYLLGGVSMYHFNPQAQLNGKWVDLQPLSLEGQGFKEYPDRPKYKLNQMNIPVGLGVRYELSSVLNARLEYVYRILNTDYLDDVSTTYIAPGDFANNGFTGNKLQNALSLYDRQWELDPTHITEPGDQRGNPKHKDAYFSFSLKIGYTFGRENVKR